MPTIQNHLTVDGEIVSSGKESGMTRDAAHAIGSWIVNFAAQPLVGVHFRTVRFVAEVTQLAASLLCRRDSTAPVRIRTETRVVHTQRQKNILSRKLVERQTARAMNYFAERDVVDIAVDEFGARRIAQRFTHQPLDRLVIVVPAIPQIEVRRIAGAMCQQQLDRDAFPALAFDLGNVIRQWVAEPHFAAFNQNHDAGGGGDNFRKTSEIENRVFRHRFACRLNSARSIGFAPNHAALSRHEDYSPGQVMLVNLALNFTVYRFEVFY